MGVRISGIGTDKLCIMGGPLKKYMEYTICTDRIVAGTYLLAVVIAGGEVLLRNLPLNHMKSTIQTIGKLGAEVYRDRYDVRIKMKCFPQGISYLCTAPYPGFPTDLQSPLLSVLCSAKEPSCIEERVFENRFLTVEELRKMGANICVIGQTAHITPSDGLQGSAVTARDLRGGAALVLAGLGAKGRTIIENADVIFRGYEDISKDFRYLGANIKILS
jgi:UDP-N-acetylglucosamine 1-carboxyvinyltransferase